MTAASCLHTENAVEFWRAMPTLEVYDRRTVDPPDESVHGELAMLDGN